MTSLRFPSLAALALVFAPGAAVAQPSPSRVYAAEITAAARRDEPALRACYENARPEARAVWRRLRSLAVTVRADGSVGDVRVNPGGTPMPQLERCVRPVVSAWRLRPPAGGADVTLTYPRAYLHRAFARATRR